MDVLVTFLVDLKEYLLFYRKFIDDGIGVQIRLLARSIPQSLQNIPKGTYLILVHTTIVGTLTGYRPRFHPRPPI